MDLCPCPVRDAGGAGGRGDARAREPGRDQHGLRARGEAGCARGRAITRGAGARLLAGGRLAVEIGPTQAQAVSDLFAAQGFERIETRQDLDGRDRVVLAHKSGDTADCGAS